MARSLKKGPYVFERLLKKVQALNETGSKSVSISFPKGTVIKSKHGRFDVGFNLQMLMLESHIILAGLSSKKT